MKPEALTGGGSSDTSPDKQPKSAADKVRELHTNVRHVTQLGMAWFAFFASLNYLTIGWLAKGPNDPDINAPIVKIVAGVFIWQNFLGILGLALVLMALASMKMQIDRFENSSEDNPQNLERESIWAALRESLNPVSGLRKSRRETTPLLLYTWIGTLLILVLVSLMAAWTIIFRYYRFK